MFGLILEIISLIMFVLMLILVVKDLISTVKYDKYMEQQHAKIMEDLRTTETLIKVTEDNQKLVKAIEEANLNIYKTAKENYILVPKEDK